MACSCPKNYHISGDWCVADAASYMRTRKICTGSTTPTKTTRPPITPSGSGSSNQGVQGIGGGSILQPRPVSVSGGANYGITASGRPAKEPERLRVTGSGSSNLGAGGSGSGGSSIIDNLTSGISNIFNKGDNTLILVGIGGFVVLTTILLLARR